jgi:hypothetical protein
VQSAKGARSLGGVCVRAVAFEPLLLYTATAFDDGTMPLTHFDPLSCVKAGKWPLMFRSMRGHSCSVLAMAARQDCPITADFSGLLCFWDFGEAQCGVFDSHGRASHHVISESRPSSDAIWSLAAHDRAPSVFTTARLSGCRRLQSHT